MWHNIEMHVWYHLSCNFSCFFFTAETVSCNYQCDHCGNLIHIYVIFQYSTILEIIIWKSIVTVFITSFYSSFCCYQFALLQMKVMFCKICNSWNISKQYTHNNTHVWYDFLCDIFLANLYTIYSCKKHKNAFFVICYVIFSSTSYT